MVVVVVVVVVVLLGGGGGGLLNLVVVSGISEAAVSKSLGGGLLTPLPFSTQHLMDWDGQLISSLTSSHNKEAKA